MEASNCGDYYVNYLNPLFINFGFTVYSIYHIIKCRFKIFKGIRKIHKTISCFLNVEQ